MDYPVWRNDILSLDKQLTRHSLGAGRINPVNV